MPITATQPKNQIFTEPCIHYYPVAAEDCPLIGTNLMQPLDRDEIGFTPLVTGPAVSAARRNSVAHGDVPVDDPHKNARRRHRHIRAMELR